MSNLKKYQQGLKQFYPEAEIEKATKYYITTQCQNIAPSKEEEPGRTHAFATKESLIPFFLQRDLQNITEKDKFFMILADSGMGKTTFMINLFLHYAKSLESKSFNIKLFPLGNPNILEEIKKIPETSYDKTVLLLDALDEDNIAIKDYQARLREILEVTQNFREIVITCRTQFFPTEEEEPKETGVLSFQNNNKEYIFRKLYISPFDKQDIKKYLGKRYSFFHWKKRKKAQKIVEQSPNLMVRPMLLSYIDDLIQDDRHYKYAYEIYEELIKRWIEREVGRRNPDTQDTYREALYLFSQGVAIDIYQKRKRRNGLVIFADEVISFAKEYHINLNDLELKSRSLLNRNAKGEYKFSHKSILEYFLALEVFQNPLFESQMEYETLPQVKSFLEEMYFAKAKYLKGQFKYEKDSQSKSFEEITSQDLGKIKYISLRKLSLDNLYVLRGFTHLERLQLSNIQLTKERLMELLHHNHLNLSRKYLMDVKPIENLVNLTHVDLAFNQLRNTKALESLYKVETLNLSTNKLESVDSLGALYNLKSLDLSDNRLKEVNALGDLLNLESLDLSYNDIRNINFLKDLKRLKSLNLSNNNVEDIEVLQSLKGLQSLNLAHNDISENQLSFLQTSLPDCVIKA